ncbi:hypothetical protein IQ07DRAFT_589038 [Pyrenochaeta sp. DS3sAY3a]|nr:hypothetical protein IQ07DRAFT_589038 [Pyrenochaeta sp. DS3sAY3a]
MASRLAANGPRRLMVRAAATLAEAASARETADSTDGCDRAGQAEWHVCVDDVSEGQAGQTRRGRAQGCSSSLAPRVVQDTGLEVGGKT